MFRHFVCEVRRDLVYRLRHCRRPHASEFNVIVLLAVCLCLDVAVTWQLFIALTAYVVML